jgi:hypothetical protein
MSVTDPIATAYYVSRVLLTVWAGVRLSVCLVRGLDLEGLVAVIVLVAALPGLRRMA